MLEPPPFERLTDREWKRIGPMVEATRGTCGGPRTDLRRAVDAIRWVLQADRRSASERPERRAAGGLTSTAAPSIVSFGCAALRGVWRGSRPTSLAGNSRAAVTFDLRP